MNPPRIIYIIILHKLYRQNILKTLARKQEMSHYFQKNIHFHKETVEILCKVRYNDIRQKYDIMEDAYEIQFMHDCEK